MKITSKTLMLNIEHNVQVGHNGAIEATLVHQAFIYRSEKTKNVELIRPIQHFYFKRLCIIYKKSIVYSLIQFIPYCITI